MKKKKVTSPDVCGSLSFFPSFDGLRFSPFHSRAFSEEFLDFYLVSFAETIAESLCCINEYISAFSVHS